MFLKNETFGQRWTMFNMPKFNFTDLLSRIFVDRSLILVRLSFSLKIIIFCRSGAEFAEELHQLSLDAMRSSGKEEPTQHDKQENKKHMLQLVKIARYDSMQRCPGCPIFRVRSRSEGPTFDFCGYRSPWPSTPRLRVPDVQNLSFSACSRKIVPRQRWLKGDQNVNTRD